MTGFLQSYGTPAIALSAITRIDRAVKLNTARGSGTYRKVHFDRGGEEDFFEFYASDVDALMKRPVQLLPAEQGTQLVYVGTHDPEPWITRTPLIAWALCFDGSIRPVTPAGVDDDTNEPEIGWWVEMRDGGFYAAVGCFDVSRVDDEAALLEMAKPHCRQPMDEATAEVKS
jgi:hypothetical protein